MKVIHAYGALLLSPALSVVVLAQQPHQAHDLNLQVPFVQQPGHVGYVDDELEEGDDFAAPATDDSDDLRRRWRSSKKAATPTRIIYPPTKLNETFDPEKAFPTPAGFLGGAKTGDERLSAEDAYPPPVNAAGLARVLTHDNKKNFDAPAAWGNLSPYNALPMDAHGIDASPAIPDGCRIAQLHVLHRHGARYPEEDDPPTEFAARLHKAVKKGTGFTARGELEFLNTWRYPLGEETLVTLGRAQLFNLGVGLRMKYGALLKEYKTRLPVFRTTSQHRMLHSALNFAAGFFGIPFEHQYHQLVITEAEGFNNTLAPHKICPGGRKAGKSAIRTWTKIFLKEAHERLALQIDGYDLKIKDVFAMLQTCAYETVALGSSPFCELFTAEEHRGLGYAADLRFHAGSFGSRVGPANGIGWARELLARLEAQTKGKDAHTAEYEDLLANGWKWGLNTTLVGDQVTFPLDGAIYVDATHDTVIAGALAALNITTLRSYGRLPRRRIPHNNWRFQSAKTVPFGANLVGQVIECHADRNFKGELKAKPDMYVRWVLNDAILNLRGVGDCPRSTLGLCPRDIFIKAIKKRLHEVDFTELCGLVPDEDGGDDGEDPEDPPEEEPEDPEEPPNEP